MTEDQELPKQPASAKELTAETVAKLAALLAEVNLDALTFSEMLKLAGKLYDAYCGSGKWQSEIAKLSAAVKKSKITLFNFSYRDLLFPKSEEISD